MSEVEAWYRYNTFLYVTQARLDALPDEIRDARVATGAVLRDLSPRRYRLRKALVRALPRAVQERLSQAVMALRRG